MVQGKEMACSPPRTGAKGRLYRGNKVISQWLWPLEGQQKWNLGCQTRAGIFFIYFKFNPAPSLEIRAQGGQQQIQNIDKIQIFYKTT